MAWKHGDAISEAQLRKEDEDKAWQPPHEVKMAIWLDANRESIAIALKASRGQLFDPKGEIPHVDHIHSLACALMDNAAQLETEGKLDESLEQYLAAIRICKQLRNWYQIWPGGGYRCSADAIEQNVYVRLSTWAARPKQTKQRILAARRQIEEITSDISLDRLVRLQHFVMRRILTDECPIVDSPSGNERSQPFLMEMWRRLPWERERALRVLDEYTSCGLQQGTSSWRDTELFYWLFRYHGLRPTCALRCAEEPCRDEASTLAEDFKAMQTVRAATRLTLTLQAWRLEHGSLPQSMDQLVGPDLKELPVDPYSGNNPFRYFREGVTTPLRCGQPVPPVGYHHDPRLEEVIPANTAIVWSTGTEVFTMASDVGTMNGYMIAIRFPFAQSRQRSFRHPNSETDIWESGWSFPIR
jgi:hypothetical protein